MDGFQTWVALQREDANHVGVCVGRVELLVDGHVLLR